MRHSDKCIASDTQVSVTIKAWGLLVSFQSLLMILRILESCEPIFFYNKGKREGLCKENSRILFKGLIPHFFDIFCIKLNNI